jgi:hypothetical protein
MDYIRNADKLKESQTIKVKPSKAFPELNKLSTTPWRRMKKFRYSSTTLCLSTRQR